MLHAWTRALNAIYANDTVYLGDRLDYMMKWRFVEAYRVRKRMMARSLEWFATQKHLELKYHELPLPGSGKKP